MSSQNPVSVNSIKSLFTGAAQSNEMSQDAAAIMVNSLNDTNILGCTGASFDELETDSVTLTSIIIDGSYSMKNNEQTVRESYDELVIKAMADSKQSGSMLVSTRVFSTDQTILYGFKKVADIGKIGSQYRADGGSTRLYDAVVDAITGIRAYAKTLNDGGVQTKCIIVVMSDGQDNDSQKNSAADAKKLAEDCIASEMFYLTYVGFKTSPSDNLDAVAAMIGFPNAYTTGNTPSEIRKAMGLVSQSVIRKSQTQIGPANTFFQ